MLTGVQDISEAIKDIFAYGSPVKAVLIQFGSSQISPQQSYHIHFPVAFFDGNNVSLKHAKAAFYKQFQESDTKINCKYIDSITNLHIHVLAPSQYVDVLHRNVQPRVDTQNPKRGNVYNINMKFLGTVENPDLTLDEENDHDISGIEPFNADSCDVGKEDKGKPDVNTAPTRKRKSAVLEEDFSSHDYIWYRVLPTVTGYKARKIQAKSSRIAKK